MSSASDQTKVQPLPGGAEAFVGRREELERLIALLEKPGLVQVLGPPGIGTTRLLEEALEEIDDDRIVGVDAIHASERPDADALLDEIRRAAQTSESGEIERTAIAEHLEAAAPVVVPFDLPYGTAAGPEFFEDLVERAPSITIVIASQRHQRFIEPSSALELEGLEPAAGVELLRRHVAISSGSPDEFGDTAELRALVDQLDGHPLALEAAADSCRVFGAAELLDRWRADDTWLFGTSKRGPRETLRRRLETSWSHLDAEERKLLRRLSQIPDTFSTELLEPLEIFAGRDAAPLEVLERLVRRRWVRRLHRRGRPQFQLLEVVRHFAARRREEHSEDDPSQFRRGLAASLQERLDTLIERLGSGPAADVFEEVRAREDLFVETARSTVDSAPTRSLGLLVRLVRFHPVCSRLDDQRDLIDRLLADHEVALPPEERVLGYSALAVLHQLEGAPNRARRAASRAVDASSAEGVESALRARALMVASLPLVKTDLEAAAERLHEANEHVDTSDRLNARIQVRRGYCALRQFELEEARQRFEAARDLLAGRTDPILRAELSAGLGYVAFRLNRIGSAIASFEDALDHERTIGTSARIAEAQFNLGTVLHDAGQLTRARGALERARDLWTDHDDMQMVALPLVRLGGLLEETGSRERARTVLRRSIRLADRFADTHNRAAAESILALSALNDADDRCPAGVFRDALDDLVVWKAPARAAVLRVASDLRVLFDSTASAPADEGRVTLRGLRSLISPQDHRLQRILTAIEAYRLRVYEQLAPEAIPSIWRDAHQADSDSPPEPGDLNCALARVLDAAVERRLSDPHEVSAFGPSAGEASHHLRIHPDALWFRVDDEQPVDLTSRKPLRRVMEAILEDSADPKGEGVSVDELIEVGWPDQTPTREAGANRVYNVIRMLREKGLSEVVVTGEDGYEIAPDVAVEIERDRDVL